MSITSILCKENENDNINAYGWVRTVRSSGTTLGFCNINDGSNEVISTQEMGKAVIKELKKISGN